MKIDINNYKFLLKVTGLFTGVQGLNIILNMVRGKLAAMLLGPVGMGLNNIYNDARELLHTMTNCGMDIAGIRGISQKVEQFKNEEDNTRKNAIQTEIKEQVKLLRSWIFIFAVFGTFFCLLLAQPISLITFSNYDHVLGYMLLSPAIGFSTLTCGEMTILKATRRLKGLAVISVLNVVLAIVITLPFYQFWGIKGVLPAIVCLSFAQFAATACYSYRYYSPRFSFEKVLLKAGTPMMKVGIAFTLTNIVSHGAQLGIRTILNNLAGNGDKGLEEVGLYGAAYTIAVSYGSVIFASLDNEFFPRLTGIFDNVTERRLVIWRQVRVSLMIAIPCALCMYFLLPWILPLLTSDLFDGALRMAQFASIGLIFRAVYLPMAYIPLAAGDSRLFMYLEFISYLGLFGCVVLGYYLNGLDGAGIGLTISIFIDMWISLVVAKVKYKV